MPLDRSIRVYSLPVFQWKNSNGSHRYQVTPEDRLTLIRSVWREGKPQTAVAFTLLQRFSFLYPKYTSLSSFIKAYSQPINPRWFPNGDLNLSAISALKAKKQTVKIKQQISALENRAKQRPVFASTPESKIPKKIIEIVDSILSGKAVNPTPTAIHFIASKSLPEDSQETAKKKATAYAKNRNLGKVISVNSGFGIGNNWFFTGKNPDKKLTAIRMTPSAVPANVITQTYKQTPIKPIPIRQSNPTLSMAILALGVAIIWFSNNE